MLPLRTAQKRSFIMLLYLFLFFFGVNFMLIGNWFLLVPFGFAIIKRKRIRVNITVAVLSAFVLVYMISEMVFSLAPEYRLIFAVIAFLLGYNYFIDVNEKNIVNVYLVIASGMGFHVLLNFILAVIKTGGIGFSATYFDFWSGTLTTTTGMMSNLMMFLPIFVFSLVYKGKSLIFIPFSALGLLFGVMTGNRSTIILFVLATLIGVVVVFFSGKKKLGIVAFAVIFVLVVFLICAYNFNWFGIKDIYDNSYLSYRINVNSTNNESVLETQRWSQKAEYIGKMLDYPWGGGGLRKSVGSYAHDIWLDTWSSGGAFAFVLLSVYIASFIYRMIRYIRLCEELYSKVLFTSYLVILILQFFVEPIIQGAPWIFISACMLDGFVSRYLANRKMITVRSIY